MLVWFWCAGCQRSFYLSLPADLDAEKADPPGECPFDLCDCGDVWLWWTLLEKNKDYPTIPYYGVTYPLYPEKGDYERIKKIHDFMKSLESCKK